MKLTTSSIAACAVAVVSPSQPAAALTIDTTGSRLGGLSPFGAPDTETLGQTFTVYGPELQLDSFSLFLGHRLQSAESETLDLRGHIASWDTANYRAGTIRFESETRTTSAGGELSEFAFSPGGLALTEGQRYVALLSISNLPAQPEIAFETISSSRHPSPRSPSLRAFFCSRWDSWDSRPGGERLSQSTSSRKSPYARARPIASVEEEERA